MLDPAIDDFFKERKDAWLKKNITPAMDEDEVREKKSECDLIFSFEEWLPKASKRAGQMSLATHPCTFSHPSARKNKNGYSSPVVADVKSKNDGYLRTGNVSVEPDALGNAAVLDVFKFLTLLMKDSRKLINHIQDDSELAVNLLTINSESYEDLKSGFLSMIERDNKEQYITSSKIKQVFFPIDANNGYHQLSILTNSGVVYELKARIDNMRFSEEVKVLRDLKRNDSFTEDSFSEIFKLTTIGYGGTKPQNISVLNNKNGGKAYLLSSLPPKLHKQDVRFPKQNFFGESFRYYDCKDVFDALHKLFKTDYNNKRIREGRDYRIQDLLDRIIDRMWAVRSVSQERHISEKSRLVKHQKIWLSHQEQKSREESDVWLDKLCDEISAWIVRSYQKLLGKNAFLLGEPERRHIQDIVIKHKEALR